MNSVVPSDSIDHSINILSRKKVKITGVTQLISFDEFSVLLSTICGNVEIDGEELHVETLDLEHGIAVLNGSINGIGYFADKRKKKSFFRTSE